MKKMLVATWSLDTQRTQDLPLAKRMEYIEGCLGRVKAKLSLSDAPADAPKAMLVVPEYFLANPTVSIANLKSHFPGDKAYSVSRYMEENEKDVYLAQLKQLSASFKDIVFIPGTIAWRKSLWRAPKGGPQTDRDAKAVRDVKAYAQAFNMPLDRRLSGDSGDVQAPTSQQKLDALQDFSGNKLFATTTYMGRNTAYVLYNGNIKLKYHKKGDYHEVTQGSDTVHIPGHLDGRFSIDGKVNCSIEVCLDHVFGTSSLTKEHYGESDVHIVASAQVKLNKDSIPIKSGGYLVHACSNQEYSKVIYNNGWFYSEPDPFAEEPNFNGAPLRFWYIGG
jgi:hypothetical protein